MLPWPLWPLAGHAKLGQNVVVGSMIVLQVSLGNVPRGVCLDPHCVYKYLFPRLRVELPNDNITPVIGTRYERGDSTGTLCIATQSTNQCRVGGRPGSCWTAWDRGCPSRPASPEWHKICLLILVRGAGVTGNLASLPATRIR